MFKLETDDGKYTFLNDNGVVSIFRYGEYWDSGNKATLSLLHLIEELTTRDVSSSGSKKESCHERSEDEDFCFSVQVGKLTDFLMTQGLRPLHLNRSSINVAIDEIRRLKKENQLLAHQVKVLSAASSVESLSKG